MLIPTITIEGREYHCTATAAKLAYLHENTLRNHAKKGLPHVRIGTHTFFNLDDIKAYFAGLKGKRERIMRYKRDTIEFDGRVYHTISWYENRYGITRYKLSKLPHRLFGKRVCLIAEDDFSEVYWFKEETHEDRID